MKKRVLVVDDEEDILSLVAAMLGFSERYDVMVAHEGQEALEIARRQSPDVVILDILMPRMNGYQVLRALKADPTTSHAKVIMLTALAQQADRERAVAAGADGFLVKPFSPTMLLSTVTQALDLGAEDEAAASNRPTEA